MSEGRASTSTRKPSLSLSHPHNPSQLPVPALKQGKGSLPSSISVPQLALGSGTGRRYPSVGDSPGHLTSPTAKSSGLPTLKTLRSLLPFGSGGNGAAGSSTGAVASPPGGKNPFPSFGTTGRRSLVSERKASGSFLRPAAATALVSDMGEMLDDERVISIEGSQRQRRDGISLKTSPVLPPSTLPAPPSACGTPEDSKTEATSSNAPSTGLVAPSSRDTALDDRQLTRESVADDPSTSRVSSSNFHDDSKLGLPGTFVSTESSTHSQSQSLESTGVQTSAEPLLGHELSTILESDLSGMSKHLPSASDSSGVELDIDDDGEEATARHGAPFQLNFLSPSRESSAPPEVEADTSLELSTSDLKNEVMSAMRGAPHRASWLDACDVEDAPDSRSPSADRSADHDADASFQLDTLDPDLAALLSPHRLPPPSPPLPSVTPPPLTLHVSHSPTNASTIGYESSPAKPPRPTFTRTNSSTPSLPRPSRVGRTSPLRDDRFRASSDTFLPLDPQSRRGSDDSTSRRTAPPSPLSLDTSQTRRLATPARRGGLYNPARLFRSAVSSATGAASTSPRQWETDRTSPSSSALAFGRRLPTSASTRPSIDDSRRPSLNLERTSSSSFVRSRNRSLSVDDPMGPSTARALAAAGLADRDRDRFGSVRSVGRYASSRLAMSDAGSGSASSWRSVSRAMTASEMGTHEWDGSTAPTSVSGYVSPIGLSSREREREKVKEAVAREREKHAVEMGALLAALADSQRTANALKEENEDLRARVDDLEAEVVRARAQLRLRTPMREVERTSELLSRPGSADGSRLRRLQPRTSPRGSPGEKQYRLDTSRSHVREAFTRDLDVSSIVAPHPVVSPLPRQPLPPPPPAVDESGASSPTATSVTGSPRSLFLRPDHEMLLDEMPSLDLRMPDSEYEGDEDGE